MRPPPHLRRALPLLVALLAAACAPVPASSSGGSAPGSPPASPDFSPGGAAPSPSLPGSTIPPLDTGPDALALEPFATGLNEPIGITSAGDGSGDLYVNERPGRIVVVAADGAVRPEPFLDITDLVGSGGERGLLGLAFHPDYPSDARFYVNYTDRDGTTRIVEYTARDGTADRASARALLTVAQPFANHNGGQLAFGPDGYLYIGLGDGGAGGDPDGNGQNPDVLLGKLLRIDVDAPPGGSRPYAIPPDNPFAPDGARPGEGAPEIWALGLRNPWRFSFDPRWGDLYIADVGQGAWEEIDRQPGDSPGGENYGWNVMEGRSCFVDASCDQRPFVKPIAQYATGEGGTCAVVGGHVYRGAAQPALDGVYVFGDYCAGRIYTLQVDQGTTTPKVVLESGLAVTAFGVAEDGELYVADLDGGAILHVAVAG